MSFGQQMMMGAAGSSTAAAFSPADITGLEAWYDASDTSSITDTSGAVDQWNDLSGNGYHMTSTGSLRPTTGTRTQNGLNVLDFDGTDDSMRYLTGLANIVSNKSATVVVVHQADTLVPAAQGLVTFTQTGGGYDYRFLVTERRTTKWGFSWGDGAAGLPGAGDYNSQDGSLITSPGTDPIVATWRIDTSGFQLSDNGSDVTLSNFSGSDTIGTLWSTNPSQLSLSFGARWAVSTASFWFNGKMCEVIVYNTYLSDGDLATLEAHLTTKWGL